MEIFSIARYPDFSEMTSYMLVCFVLVTAVLWILSFATNLIAIPFKLKDSASAKKAAAEKAKAQALAENQAKEAKKQSEKVATLISSAVYAAMDGAPHRIISITPSSCECAAVSNEVAAVISAAVFATLEGGAFRINSIKPAAPDFNWASSGRNAIFASKNPKF